MRNFSPTALKLLSSYLRNRNQSVYHASKISRSCSTPRAVPQSSILGPLLYSIYANDLPLNVEHCQIHIYADDVLLYISCAVDDASNCIRLINRDLHKICLRASANGLSLNRKKSAVLIIGQPKTDVFPPIHINNVNINIVESVKNLGVILNKQLKLV